MKTALFTLAVIFMTGCNQESSPTSPDGYTEGASPNSLSKAGKGIVHHVSAGTNDADPSVFGVKDASFSLVANEKANGNVTGNWVDVVKSENGNENSVHVSINSMKVVDNYAILTGIVKKGIRGGVDVTGRTALTMVRDNGTSANDPADEISFSIVLGEGDTRTSDDFTLETFTSREWLFPIKNGQVKVN
ncbi:hypothetical protein ACFLR4_01185 [Bacteroidota bacterium]